MTSEWEKLGDKSQDNAPSTTSFEDWAKLVMDSDFGNAWDALYKTKWDATDFGDIEWKTSFPNSLKAFSEAGMPSKKPDPHFEDGFVEEELGWIEDWLNNPQSNLSQGMLLQRSKPLSKAWLSPELTPMDVEDFLYMLQIKAQRFKFVGADKTLWFMDVAYRADTGEPVVTVSHKVEGAGQ